MKKNEHGRIPVDRDWRKIGRVMKLTTIIYFVCLMQVSATVYSQSTKFTFHVENMKVVDVLKRIEDSSKFRFFYQNEQVDVNRSVSIKVNDATVEQILDEMFAGKDIGYKVMRDFLILLSPKDLQAGPLGADAVRAFQQKIVSGKVTDTSGQPLPGVTVVLKGTTQGTVANADGEYSLAGIPDNATLVFSFVGMKTQEVVVGSQTSINVRMEEESIGIEEVVAIGYGTQKKSDITGTVASLPEERLDMVPNLNIAQAIQGAIPGVMITQSSGGTEPNENIMIRGRNSITASNSPLVVLDGVPYGGPLSSINPSDVLSIEVLKDASATAIYGSRGANGVILIASKRGEIGAPKIEIDAKFGVQDFIHLPRLMNGEEFYNYKMERSLSNIKAGETEMYEAGEWTDWADLGFRKGKSQKYNISVTGATEHTSYYFSGSFMDIKGIAVGDNLQRISGRINIETNITKWFSIGTRTQLVYDDKSGIPPGWGISYGSLYGMNPLTKAYDENGNLLRYPAPWDTGLTNPLRGQLWDNSDLAFQVVSNNFVKVDIPFIPGLTYTSNTGIRRRNHDVYTYKDRRTTDLGEGNSTNYLQTYLLVDNIISYNKTFKKNNITATALYSFEKNQNSSTNISGSNYPNDFITRYAINQAASVTNSYDYTRIILLSQMFRLNYSYDSRYLLTGTVRRDGYSGFGSSSKWGIFPSFAVGYNVANEEFFPWKDLFNELKVRASYGVNGNQAVAPYKTLATLNSYDYATGRNMDYVTGETSLAGYIPSGLGMDDLGWESSATINLGVDFGILQNRITGDINLFKTKTTDLLLNRSISLVHGISSITQNIGEVENKGVEFRFNSQNISKGNFYWSTSANISFTKNKIVSLYGILDDEQREIDDASNGWFIGQPIRVAYGYKRIGTWQLDELEEAAVYNSEPGFVKLLDVNRDGNMTVDDKVIQGQGDPKFIWGMNNSLSYKNLKLDIFIHGVHGVTKSSSRLQESTSADLRLSSTLKPWWTEDNPTNDWIKNDILANQMGGVTYILYEDASFIRVKDITLSYDLPFGLFDSKNNVRFYITGRNLFTITNWYTLDPELASESEFPMQKELVLGVTVNF